MPLFVSRRLAGVVAALCLPTTAWSAEPPSDPGSPAPPAAAAEPAPLTPVDVGLDLIPLVGTSGIHRGHDRRGLSAGVVTWSGALDGFEVTLGAGLVGQDVDGVQITTGLNAVVGSVDGLQGAAGGNLVGGSMDGLQASGGLNVALGSFDGLQVSGGGNLVLGDTDGLQVAGGVSLTGGRHDGMQAAGGLALAGELDGLQLAPINVTTGHVSGLQLGVINVARTSEASLGLINLIWKGRTHLDVTVDEASFGTVAIQHGSERFHNYWGASLRPLGDCPEWALLYGLGGHFELGPRSFVELDALVRHISPTEGLLIEMNDLYTARLGLGVQVAPGVALTGAASWNTFVSTWHDGSHYSTWDSEDLASDPDLVVRTWPGFSVGVRLLPAPKDRAQAPPPTPADRPMVQPG